MTFCENDFRRVTPRVESLLPHYPIVTLQQSLIIPTQFLVLLKSLELGLVGTVKVHERTSISLSLRHNALLLFPLTQWNSIRRGLGWR